MCNLKFSILIISFKVFQLKIKNLGKYFHHIVIIQIIHFIVGINLTKFYLFKQNQLTLKNNFFTQHSYQSKNISFTSYKFQQYTFIYFYLFILDPKQIVHQILTQNIFCDIVLLFGISKLSLFQITKQNQSIVKLLPVSQSIQLCYLFLETSKRILFRRLILHSFSLLKPILQLEKNHRKIQFTFSKTNSYFLQFITFNLLSQFLYIFYLYLQIKQVLAKISNHLAFFYYFRFEIFKYFQSSQDGNY
ncbi:transmembrane protein, putative (macronuclear) [Tetrahymena thermophila SB210]|uniref:Transmembrane protein, putative n=1 Tax=Tetrahymena thermophila (strain SB210) TaxID=312017 RepID=W7X672_TETTS|nr:transmembrane protein, putative [Tetrahymena thermophila SB210]EWS74865.1 transmembrane protein, putative [Tetrahymena thermophila SB210]|eukprot:XP_012652578.1 transmembrane protein, putative [Tetrahymena thermophila SB210]